MSQLGIDRLSEAELGLKLRFPSKAEEIELARAVEGRTNFFTQHDFCYNRDYSRFPLSLGEEVWLHSWLLQRSLYAVGVAGNAKQAW